MSFTGTVAAGLEQVRDEIKFFKNYDTGLMRYLNPSKTAEISRWLYRQIFKKYSGGSQSKVDFDGGVLPNGTGPKLDYFQSGFFNEMLALAVTDETRHLEESSAQSKFQTVADIMENAQETYNAHSNTALFGDGSGKLTNAASTGTSTTLTFAAAGDTRGTRWLFPGRVVDVWDSAGTTKRANGPYKIESVDHANNIVTFATAPTGMATTDLVTVPALDVYGPAAPTTGSADWPVTNAKTAAGLGGDSWIHGLQYVNSTLTNYLTKARASFPELQAVSHNADGAGISYELAEVIAAKMIRHRNGEIIKGCMAVVDLGQKAALKAKTVNVTRVNRDTAGGKMVNLQPTDEYNETTMWGPFPLFDAMQQHSDRLDIFNPEVWGTVESGPADWYSGPDGGIKFFPRYNSDGRQLATYDIRLKHIWDLTCHDPGGPNAWVYSLAVPSGF